MQIVIEIPEDVYTRLFDNGIQDNEIAVDDICEMARALRLGTPLDTHDEEIIATTVESIWGKPPYTELLDKIRAEIEEYRDSLPWENNSIVKWDAINYILEQIIDKYKNKIESE